MVTLRRVPTLCMDPESRSDSIALCMIATSFPSNCCCCCVQLADDCFSVFLKTDLHVCMYVCASTERLGVTRLCRTYGIKGRMQQLLCSALYLSTTFQYSRIGSTSDRVACICLHGAFTHDTVRREAVPDFNIYLLVQKDQQKRISC